MKQRFNILATLALLFLAACENDETQNQGRISFSLSKLNVSEGRISTENPTAMLITVEDNNGNAVYTNKKLSLLKFGEDYISDDLVVNTGSYRLTKFMVVDANNNVVYATPTEGSERAYLVNDALPIEFVIKANESTQVIPQVLAVQEGDSPASFGYASFSFEIVETGIKTNLKVSLTIGGVIYEDVNTNIIITGVNASGEQTWKNVIAYKGPYTNEITLPGDHLYYTFEMQALGVYDQKTITKEELYQGRADGPTPITHTLGGAIDGRKLSHTIFYFETQDPGNPGITYMQPQTFVEYKYNAEGKLSKILYQTYNTESKTFINDRYKNLVYASGKVSTISTYNSDDQLTTEHSYTYNASGNVSKIVEKNYSGVSGEVNFTYNNVVKTVKATYSFSNGSGFIYEFVYDWNNIVSAKTTKGGELCNQGVYAYDKNINPMSHLGFVEFTLGNFSINNKTSESINYQACSFPSLVPESFSYWYDGYGYPLVLTTVYKGSGAKSQLKYYYK